MTSKTSPDLVALDTSRPIWEQFFTAAPLVLVGTRDAHGNADLAPKHMVTPMGWDNCFGFVCTPRHATYSNIARDGVFTVSYPRPSQMLYASLAATPRWEDDTKPILSAFETFPATRVAGDFIRDAYLYLECEHLRTYDDFGDNSLIAGRIVAAAVARDAFRMEERDDQDLINESPLFVYLHPGRYASVSQSMSLPLPEGMKR